MPSSRRPLVLLALLLIPRGVAAQDRGYTALRWWHPVVASAGLALTFLIDQPVHDYMQEHQDSTLTDIADVAKRFHEPEVTIVAGTGAMGLGLLFRQWTVAQTGLQILASYGLASGMMIATKWAFGRSRPNATPDDNTTFDWFDGGENSSFPSGAAVVTFSLATTIADAVDHPGRHGGAVRGRDAQLVGAGLRRSALVQRRRLRGAVRYHGGEAGGRPLADLRVPAADGGD